MGGKGSKDKPKNPTNPTNPSVPVKPVVIPSKAPGDLAESDYNFLTSQTGLSRGEIKSMLDKFNANNPDGKLDKKEFVRLYDELRPEPPELMDEIAEFVFRGFDADNNGSINFNEFLVAYALTSRGDPRKKLEYAFELYDADNNGSLDRNEVRDVLFGMLDLLGADKKANNVDSIVVQCMHDLDSSNDGRITKDEFINGLMKNYSLRVLMSPFG